MTRGNRQFWDAVYYIAAQIFALPFGVLFLKQDDGRYADVLPYLDNWLAAVVFSAIVLACVSNR